MMPDVRGAADLLHTKYLRTLQKRLLQEIRAYLNNI